MRLKNTFLWITTVGFSVSASAWIPTSGYCQELDVFGDEVEASDEGGGGKSNVPVIRSGLAASFLSTDPKTPEANFAFLETLISVKEEEAAWYYLSRLGDQPLEGEAALRFVEKIGTARIIKFTGHKDFPEGKKDWFKATSKNAFDFLNNVETLDKITEGILSDQPEVRKNSIRRVQASGHMIVFPLMKRIQDSIVDDKNENLSKFRSAIYRGSRKWNQAIVDIATVSDPFQSAAVFASLNRPANSVSDAFLMAHADQIASSSNKLVQGLYQSWKKRFEEDYGFVPEGSSARRWAELKCQRAKRIFDDYIDGKIDRSILAENWKVNAETLFLEQQDVTTFYLAAKNLQFWKLIESKLASDQSKVQRQKEYVSSVIRAEKIRMGFDRQLSAIAEKAIADSQDQSASTMELLNRSVNQKDWIVTLGLLQWLEKNPQNVNLKMVGNKNSAVVRCLHSPDPRVRAKAVLAALKSPQKGVFAGSSQFNRAVTKVLTAPDAVQAIVATTHQKDADLLTAAVRADGWKVLEVSPTKLLPMIQNNRLAFAIVTDALGTDRFVPTLDRIRSTPAGKNLPIFLCVRPENEEKARRMFRVDRFDSLTQIVSIDRAEVDLPKKISQAISQVGFSPIPQIIAQADRYLVLQNLSRWANDPELQNNLDFQLLGDSVRDLVFLPEIGRFASNLLSKHGNAKSQTALLDSASSIQTSPAVRSAAAKGFRQSVQRFGLLLTATQLKTQYKRQNQSGKDDKFSQDIHNSLLDTIEARHRKVKFEDLSPVPEANN